MKRGAEGPEALGGGGGPGACSPGKFLKFGVSVMHFPAFWPRNYDS